MTTHKKLYILRHAKAEIGAATQDDHARRLVPRGEKAAQIMGAYLFKQGIRPDKVMCSDALRTRETWANMEDVFAEPLNVEYTPRLYMASAHEILAGLADLSDALESVLVIAHNPGVHQLCLKLAKEGDEDVMDSMFIKFPTCAFAALSLGEVAWADAMNARATLLDFITPKMLAGMEDD